MFAGIALEIEYLPYKCEELSLAHEELGRVANISNASVTNGIREKEGLEPQGIYFPDPCLSSDEPQIVLASNKWEEKILQTELSSDL